MTLKVAICPHCNKTMSFKVHKDDIDHTGRYPVPIYVLHSDGKCDKYSTAYFDSVMHLTMVVKDKQDGSKWSFVKEISTSN